MPRWKQLYRAAEYRPLVLEAERLFAAVGMTIQRMDYRTLEIAGLASSGEKGGKYTAMLRCARGKPVGRDEVDEFAERLKTNLDGGAAIGFLMYEKDLEPESRWRLDSLRLREGKAIIPLPLPYVKRALDKGRDQAREALDSLKRRYLGQQDLFDIRNALDEPTFFFGRRSLIDEIIQGLSRGEHVAVIGQRKIGKTSLLNILAQYLDRFPIVSIDLQIYARNQDWPGRLFRKIVEQYDAWGRSRFEGKWRPDFGVGNDLSGADFERAIRVRYKLQVGLGLREALVVVLDEIERLFPRSEKASGTPEETWRYIEAAGALRALGQHQGGRLLSLIVADRALTFNRINHFDIGNVDTNPFYQLFAEKFVKPLTEDECTQMLQDIGHAMGVTVVDELCTTIFRDSGGYPRLARLLGSAAYQGRHEANNLGPEEYACGLAWLRDEDGGIDDFIRENIWKHVSRSERIVLGRCAAETSVPPEVIVAEGPLYRLLQASNSAETANWISADEGPAWASRHLRSTGLLEEASNGLRVRGALVRAWLRENVPQAGGE